MMTTDSRRLNAGYYDGLVTWVLHSALALPSVINTFCLKSHPTVSSSGRWSSWSSREVKLKIPKNTRTESDFFTLLSPFESSFCTVSCRKSTRDDRSQESDTTIVPWERERMKGSLKRREEWRWRLMFRPRRWWWQTMIRIHASLTFCSSLLLELKREHLHKSWWDTRSNGGVIWVRFEKKGAERKRGEEG